MADPNADVTGDEAVSGAHPFSTTIDAPATGSSRLAVSPDGRLVYVTDGPGRALRVVDPRTRATVVTAPVADLPTGVAVAGGRVYVADASGSVTTFDAVSLRPLGVAHVGSEPLCGLDATPDGRRLYLVTDGGIDAVDLR